MPSFGFTLMGEQFPPEDLVRNAQLAEQAGFDFAAFSDHFHPWLDAQGHSPFAWSVLGAVAARTERIGLITMVTCPTHPLPPGDHRARPRPPSRGSVGGRFDARPRRRRAPQRARRRPAAGRRPTCGTRCSRRPIEIIRLLWRGGFQSFRGRAPRRCEDARLYTLPDAARAARRGRRRRRSAAELAGRIADGLIATEPEASLRRGLPQRRRRGKPRYGAGRALAGTTTRPRARRIARERWRFALAGLEGHGRAAEPGQLRGRHAGARREDDDRRARRRAGPDPEVHLQAIQHFLDAGYDRIAVVQTSLRPGRLPPLPGSTSSPRACSGRRSAPDELDQLGGGVRHPAQALLSPATAGCRR